MSSDRLLELKRNIEDKKRKQDRLLGQREEKMKQLKAAGASALEEAQEMLADKKKELKRKEAKMESDLEEFETKYSEVLS
jgi:chromosome segregation ATPase